MVKFLEASRRALKALAKWGTPAESILFVGAGSLRWNIFFPDPRVLDGEERANCAYIWATSPSVAIIDRELIHSLDAFKQASPETFFVLVLEKSDFWLESIGREMGAAMVFVGFDADFFYHSVFGCLTESRRQRGLLCGSSEVQSRVA